MAVAEEQRNLRQLKSVGFDAIEQRLRSRLDSGVCRRAAISRMVRAIGLLQVTSYATA